MKYFLRILWLFLLSLNASASTVDSLLVLFSQAREPQKTELAIKISQVCLNDSLPMALAYAKQAVHMVPKDDPFIYIDALKALADAFYEANQTDSALLYFQKITRTEHKLDLERFIDCNLKMAQCYKQKNQFDSVLGVFEPLLLEVSDEATPILLQRIYDFYINTTFKLSDLEKTHELIGKKLVIDSLLNDSIHLGEDYNNLSTVHRKQGKYHDAIGFSKKALFIFEKINDSSGLASAYNTLGGIYYYTDDYEQAIRHFSKATELYEKIGDTGILPGVYNNLGSVYNELNKYNKALEYYQKSLQLYKKQNNLYAEAILTGNMGLVLVGLGDFNKAETYFNTSLNLQKLLENKEGILHAYSNLGGLYLKKGNYAESEMYYHTALEMATEGGYSYERLNISKEMVELKEVQGKFSEALELLKQHQMLKDTLQNQESRDQLNAFQAQLDLKEHQSQIEILNKEKEITNEKYKRQQLISLGVFVVAFLLFVLVVMVFFALRINRRAKRKLELVNSEIKRQSRIIEVKNKQFTDSIAYAGRVQKALFSPLANLEEYLNGFFIISKPQNLVSGDFFWYKIAGQNLYLALVDCTGHGVPGAFMSILGNTLLNEVVDDSCTKNTHDILNELRLKIKTSLHQTNMQGNTDGMDMTLCRISKEEQKLYFSGANNPLFRVRQNQIEEFKADKMPVSVSLKEIPFTTQGISFEPGDRFYLSTDGYFDQFGGSNQEKITRKNFKTLAAKLSQLPFGEQAKEFDRFFDNWKLNSEQTDDMTVVGFQII